MDGGGGVSESSGGVMSISGGSRELEEQRLWGLAGGGGEDWEDSLGKWRDCGG